MAHEYVPLPQQGIPPGGPPFAGSAAFAESRTPPADFRSERSDRDRGDRPRDSRDHSDRDRGDARDRDFGRDRGRGRDRDRDRSDRRDRDRDRPKRRKSRSKSRSSESDNSPSPPPRRRKVASGWDVNTGAAPGFSGPPSLPHGANQFPVSSGLPHHPSHHSSQFPVSAPPHQSHPSHAFPPMMSNGSGPEPPAPAAPSFVHPDRMRQIGSAPTPMPMIVPPMPQGPQHLQSMQLNATNRQARRLYVGNLPLHTTEDMLKVFFNDAMARSNPNHQSGDAVVSVYLNLPKKFGFVEFRTMEEATAALQLDGITFQGCDLKVRRPSDYDTGSVVVEARAAAPTPQLDVSRLGIISTQVPDGPNKVFCGGLPYDLGEKEVKELVSVYGPLKAFHLVKDKDAVTSKGYAFFEYAVPDVTDAAIMGLNGIQIGSKTLTVRRAQPKSALSSSSDLMPIPPIAALGLNPLAMGGLMAPVLPAATQIPTRVICLLQMVSPDELQDDQEYREIVEDVEEECRKYGRVRKVVIPRPNRDPIGVGKVFVEFEATEEAAKARQALEGRQFASRIVVATFYSEESFAQGDL